MMNDELTPMIQRLTREIRQWQEDRDIVVKAYPERADDVAKSFAALATAEALLAELLLELATRPSLP